MFVELLRHELLRVSSGHRRRVAAADEPGWHHAHARRQARSRHQSAQLACDAQEQCDSIATPNQLVSHVIFYSQRSLALPEAHWRTWHLYYGQIVNSCLVDVAGVTAESFVTPTTVSAITCVHNVHVSCDVNAACVAARSTFTHDWRRQYSVSAVDPGSFNECHCLLKLQI